MFSIIGGLLSGLARSRLWLLLLPLLGTLLPYVGWIFQGLANIARAIVEGFIGILADWKRVLATLTVCAVCFSGGIRTGVWATKEVAIEAFGERDQWIAAHGQLMADAEAAEQKNKENFDAALQAGIRAELEKRCQLNPKDCAITQATAALKGPAGAGSRPGGVRRSAGKAKAARGSNNSDGQSLSRWLYSVYSGILSPNAK